MPIPVKGKVFMGTVMVMEKCTHSIPVNNPTGQLSNVFSNILMALATYGPSTIKGEKSNAWLTQMPIGVPT